MISIQLCNFTPGELRDLGSGSDCAPLVHSEQHAFCNLKNMRITNFKQSAECQGGIVELEPPSKTTATYTLKKNT